MSGHTLRFRISVWHASLLAGSLMLYGGLTYIIVQHYLIRGLEISVEYHARTIGEKLLVNLKDRGEAYVTEELNERYAAEIYPRFIRITRRDGSILYRSGPPIDDSFDPASLPAPSSPIKRSYLRTELLPGDHHLQIFSLPFTCPDGTWYLIESGRTFDTVDNVLHRLLLVLVVGLPLIVGVSLLGGSLFMKQALRPLEDIRWQAERISSTIQCEPIPVPNAADEIGRLAISLNRMIARLDEAFQQSSRFSANVSHELRTPLTILRGELEGALRQPGLHNLLDAVGSALEETDRLQKIVDRLLEISRLDEGKGLREKVCLDLGGLARTTAEQMQLLAEVKSIDIRYMITEGVEVEGDPIYLKQAIVNLLDNAIKYAAEGGWVMVQVAAESRIAVLEITDNGPGMPAEALPFLFDRFYRADKARSRDTGGVGLGLAIVKAICTAHKAEINGFNAVPHGGRFRIDFALASNQQRAATESRPSARGQQLIEV
jgi:heavy metal sensor kinase